MTYQENELLKLTREYKAAEELANAHNCLGFSNEKFAQGIALQHCTLQQQVIKSFVALIRVMASDDYGFDDRNKGSHEAAKKMVASGILDEIYLPFI